MNSNTEISNKNLERPEPLQEKKAVRETVTVIVPCVVAHNLDVHTGIPFMPHMAAHFAGALDAAGYKVQVIDCFGLQPHHTQVVDEFMMMGVSERWAAEHIHPNSKIAFLYCRTVEDLVSTERLCLEIKKARPEIKICAFENIQTVNSFSLKELAEELIKKGCDMTVFGEPEKRAETITESLLGRALMEPISGIAYKKGEEVHFTPSYPFDKDLDALPLPLWEKFPLEGYWIARFAHAPVKKEKFLPILTSRGCPYKCTFCIAPSVNYLWRYRSANNVVDEMEYFYKRLGITDFHVSDLDPTVNDERTREIAHELIRRKLPITWKLAQGTKIETIKSEETLQLLARAGCRFISFSPETGSKRLLKIVQKPFDHEHGLRMAKEMNRLGVRIQACFVAGIPGETESDRKESLDYVKQLVKAGVDEIAVTIFTPLPGAKLSEALKGYTHYSQLTHSPSWRKDYKNVERFRFAMYLTFFMHKLTYPRKVIREFMGFLTGQFETKMEMSLSKWFKFRILRYFPSVLKRMDSEKILTELDQITR